MYARLEISSVVVTGNAFNEEILTNRNVHIKFNVPVYECICELIALGLNLALVALHKKHCKLIEWQLWNVALAVSAVPYTNEILSQFLTNILIL